MDSGNIALLADRGLVRVAGADAGKLLQDLVTNDMGLLGSCPAIHAGLLSPQGKILFEFFIAKAGDAFLLDTGCEQVANLVKRLTLYKLRAKVEIGDASGAYVVHVLWPAAGSNIESSADIVAFPDPRAAELGMRIIATKEKAATLALRLGLSITTADGWHAHRIALGVPEAGKDYRLADTFPHEANFDQLNGVSFTKGCFVGQEVVSRMQHRSGGRKRVVAVRADAPLTAGAEVKSGMATIGVVGSVAGERGLALVRLDRAIEGEAKGEPLTAGGVAVALVKPAWATFEVAAAAHTEAT
jgi:folate-binding protein YgfZ